MNAEPWVTAIDVAQHLGVVKDTVYRWREHKGLPAHKIGRLWKFQLSEVDEWVRAGGADEQSAPNEDSAKKAQVTRKQSAQGPGRPEK
ncbi:helix-turn-helix domain-containing protein [Aquabacterium sp.]|uniref:helix-turn-helix domain-containing protein n=1 Tax=Aquabacterium sp. TaxID=1872578 RepID=UPI00260C7156|nr:helix-turn-helix domain-containing protein [Aquabacterium sp.]MDD2977110.1 helix-turn-helix domain-containing protein [Aquabacterium sp.]